MATVIAAPISTSIQNIPTIVFGVLAFLFFVIEIVKSIKMIFDLSSASKKIGKSMKIDHFKRMKWTIVFVLIFKIFVGFLLISFFLKLYFYLKYRRIVEIAEAKL